MRMMREIGKGKLLKAVDIANSHGSPTLTKVQQILLHNGKTNETDMDKLDKAILDDDFYVEQRKPSDYDALWGAVQEHPKQQNKPDNTRGKD
jgi:hypothetical protein